MAEISNKFLAFLVVLTLGLSAFSTFALLDKINLLRAIPEKPVTAKATVDQGKVNFTVESQVSIVLTNDVIDFGIGVVNDSKCSTNATLYAGATYNDSEDIDCWAEFTGSQPVSFNIQNDGNRNVQLTVLGPTEQSFFNGYAGSNPYNLTWRGRNNKTDSCVPGATLQDTYTNFGNLVKQVCSNLSYPAASDEISVDVSVMIPQGLPPGIYENSNIEFTASAV